MKLIQNHHLLYKIKKPCMFIWIFFFSFSTTICQAGIENLLATQNLQEFEHYVRQNQKQELLKTTCFLQLQKRKIPTACYEWFSQTSLFPQKELLNYLDEKCLEFAVSLKHLKELTPIIMNPHISPTCRNKIQKIKNILIYQLRDSSPEIILHWHLKKKFQKKF